MSPFARATRAVALDAIASHSPAPSSGATRPRRLLPTPRTLLVGTAVGLSALLLVAACSSSPTHAAAGNAAPRALRAGAPGLHASKAATNLTFGLSALGPTVQRQLSKLAPPAQSRIYTANLEIRARDVQAAATAMTSLVTAVGGYVSNEQETIPAGSHGTPAVTITFKIPVAQYQPTLALLATKYGAALQRHQQALDVTQEVADVNSRVASAQAAITQLRALLARAGNVGSLLAVQDEINSQESALESLLAQQQALAHETSYGTVSVLLVGHHVAIVKKSKKKSRGFIAGLGAGWHALVTAVDWLLTAIGAVLPFAVLVAALAGIAIGARRRQARRRGTAATDPPAAVL